MKIRTRNMALSRVENLPRPGRKKPVKPNIFFRTLIRAVSAFDLFSCRFTYEKARMEEMGEGPWLVLMNHSSFIDLEIASRLMYPKPFSIVCTSDGFVGKEWLMRAIGCIPTRKFVTDMTLVDDMRYALGELKTSVLMYPEASYSFDGTATPLPRRLGVLLKRLGVPVVMITTQGAFARDPLYNGLQKRKVRVSARMEGLLTADEVREKSVSELDEILDRAFSFDNFAWQAENGIEIKEPFRADGLNRILYKCAFCGKEGHMEGRGTQLTCRACGKSYELTELGRLSAHNGVTEFSHIPHWYRWQRQMVRRELEEGTYLLDVPVKIGVMVDYKAIYMVGEGRLRHSAEGFTLTGCGGELNYSQKPIACYGLYSDYYWYEIGDVICIGNNDTLYYCFPQEGDVVAKTRLAAEELFKMAAAARLEQKMAKRAALKTE